MRSDFDGPVNIGSEEMVTIDALADMIMTIAEKRLEKRHIPGPLGVRGRNSDNRLIRQKLGWAPSLPLKAGLRPTYSWIERQVQLYSRQQTPLGCPHSPPIDEKRQLPRAPIVGWHRCIPASALSFCRDDVNIRRTVRNGGHDDHRRSAMRDHRERVFPRH